MTYLLHVAVVGAVAAAIGVVLYAVACLSDVIGGRRR